MSEAPPAADTPLHAACDADAVLATLKAGGVAVNARGGDNETPLRRASRLGHVGAARALLKHGARLGEGDEVRSATGSAAASGRQAATRVGVSTCKFWALPPHSPPGARRRTNPSHPCT